MNRINLRSLFWGIAILSLLACGNQEGAKNENVGEKLDTSEAVKTVTINNKAIWVFETMLDTIIQNRKVEPNELNYENLIGQINAKYNPKVQLDFIKIKRDTLFVKIDNSSYLTQQMGSAGAYEYMISTTFVLTELPNITQVNFQFELGDHANPGTYNRKYYIDRMNENRRLNK